ncbi:MAG: hypothetical protein L6R39_002359 [Caloplaca ligustica]|nr:MAG: hypothetical protein L6R39_002359 [Caloplaca ligustica]
MSFEVSRERNRSIDPNGQGTVQGDEAMEKPRLSTESDPLAKKQSTWSSIRAGVKRRNPISKWLSSSPVSSDEEPAESKWPNDEKESLFCNALVGLMHRSGRYHDLGLDKRENEGPERKKRKSSKSN